MLGLNFMAASYDYLILMTEVWTVRISFPFFFFLLCSVWEFSWGVGIINQWAYVFGVSLGLRTGLIGFWGTFVLTTSTQYGYLLRIEHMSDSCTQQHQEPFLINQYRADKERRTIAVINQPWLVDQCRDRDRYSRVKTQDIRFQRVGFGIDDR